MAKSYDGKGWTGKELVSWAKYWATVNGDEEYDVDLEAPPNVYVAWWTLDWNLECAARALCNEYWDLSFTPEAVPRTMTWLQQWQGTTDMARFESEAETWLEGLVTT